MYVGVEEFSIQDLNLAKDDTILFQRMGKGDVYYWDDGYTFEESDDDQNVYLLGEDFSMFDIRK